MRAWVHASMPLATSTGDRATPNKRRSREHDTRIRREDLSAGEQEGEEEEETFSQARDTDTTTAEITNDGEVVDETVVVVGTEKPIGSSRASSPSSMGLQGSTSPSAAFPHEGNSGGRRNTTGRKEEEEEEWCVGHVCLRLRPDGLRERRSSGNSSVRREREDTGEERSEDEGSGSNGEVWQSSRSSIYVTCVQNNKIARKHIAQRVNSSKYGRAKSLKLKKKTFSSKGQRKTRACISKTTRGALW